MPKMMSFRLTIPQMRDQSKTLTTRMPETWKTLMPGTKLWAVEQVMGLKKGDKVTRIGIIRVTRVCIEPLDQMTNNDCVLEGFPEMVPAQFIQMLSEHYGYKFCAETFVRRIWFEHLTIENGVQEELAWK